LNSPCETEHFCLWFSPSCGNELFEFSSRPEFSNLIRLKEADTESVLLGLDKITDSETAVTKFEKLSIILHLILSMAQKNGANDADTIGISPELKEIIAYINREFQSIEKLTDITQRFNISSATLNRWFKKNIHISPQEYLKARRLSHAKQLLDNGASVTESCMMSGFSDCSYFISVFKQKFGETPHKYKKRLQ
jgi:AraC-like DNA-binding protein